MLSTTLPIYASDPPFFSSPAQVGIIFSASAIVALLLRVPLGILSDRLGRKTVFLTSLVANLVSFLIFYTATNTLTLLIASALKGIESAIFVPTMLATISDLFSGQRKQEVLGFYTLSSAVGIFLGPFIISLLLTVTDLRTTFFVALMIELVVILFSFLRIRSFRFPYRPQTGIRKSIGRILSNKDIIGSTFALSTSVFALTAVTVFLPFFTDQRLGLDPARVVTLFTIRSFALVSMRTLTVLRLQDKIEVKRLILVSLLLHSGISLIPISQNYYELILPLLLSGIAHGVLYPTTAYIVSESTMSKESGLANAFYMLALDLASFLGPLLLGLAAEKFSISLVFLVGAVAPLLGILVSYLTIKNR